MRIFLIILITILGLQFQTRADEISNFEIEGISIGDSALKFFSEEHIKSNSKNYYKSKKYIPVQNDKTSFFKTYDAVDFAFKNDDKNYTIVSLVGIIQYHNKNIKDCYKKMDEIVSDLDKILINQKKYPKRTYKHSSPKNKSGKSIVTDIQYEFKGGDSIVVACYDYSIEHGDQDHLSVAIDTDKFIKWLTHEAWK